MAMVPRSIALVTPPVWRSRWKRSERPCRCWKVRIATTRITRCLTGANTASRSSPKPPEAIRSRP